MAVIGSKIIFLQVFLPIILIPHNALVRGLSPNLEVCNKKDISEDQVLSKINCGHRDDNAPDDEAILCVRPALKCNFVNDCPVINSSRNEIPQDEQNCATTSCNFEKSNVCGWEVTNSVWSIAQDATYKLVDGSTIRDHTFGINAGHFLAGNFSTLSPGSKAVISTPIIGETAYNCTVEFYYYVLPGTDATLRIQHSAVVHSKNNSLETITLRTIPLQGLDLEISTDDGILNKEWKYAKAFWLKSTYYKIQLAIEINSPSKGILLDDIKFLNCQIPDGTPSSSMAGFETNCEFEETDCGEEGECPPNNCKTPEVIPRDRQHNHALVVVCAGISSTILIMTLFYCVIGKQYRPIFWRRFHSSTSTVDNNVSFYVNKAQPKAENEEFKLDETEPEPEDAENAHAVIFGSHSQMNLV